MSRLTVITARSLRTLLFTYTKDDDDDGGGDGGGTNRDIRRTPYDYGSGSDE